MRWTLLMLLLWPLSIALYLLHAPDTAIFVCSAMSIVPLAGTMGSATEALSCQLGPAAAGMLNATFGNATELIIALVAIRSGQISIVKASLIGSIIGNILLVLGASVLVGGIRFKMQCFNRDVAQSHATMLGMAAISLVVPAMFVRDSGMVEAAINARVEHLSLGVAGVMIVLYFGGLIFTLRTHESLFLAADQPKAEPPPCSKKQAIIRLALSTLGVAIASELLVGSVETVVRDWHIGKLFLGVILVPIVGNAAEHSTAVMMALKNRIDVSLSISVSSSTQIAMFVAPLIIFLSPLFGHPMTILFTNYELVALCAAVLIAVLISMDGKTHWLEGAQLLAAYAIVSLAFYFVAG